MGRVFFATLLGAAGGLLIGPQIANATFDWYQAPLATMAYTITGAIFGAACVWVARWDRSRKK